MVSVYKHRWAILDVVGMVLLAIGAYHIMTQFPYPKTAEVVLIAGLGLIIVSSIFIYLDGRDLRKEDMKLREFEEVRAVAREVPNDLRDGYLIDLTADPENVVVCNCDPGNCGCRNDDDIVVIFSN
ncbi:MAG: hypothetical protein FWC44_00055 [Methanomassiliicoccaceae archaeon]|nr:hypothetical protein [Methanomassiliicoccaceae archaeon]